ncbi:BZ3500_MvSof-1268-A1-R1_Chr2-1g04116 [Microbotryum saponariae]|uniref:BZ3500_MvSof-1268-A1-R1_Chr2-1g04116 protein n=1 Tax=Microbotryum saponariae TaxID=289078 RepID=A0A2X0KPH3_9BASI|nr:BZ3500_MvSof-1268-A1-R1_Chr2-1g04116 [Microbotryum saponariae]SCZ91103.1 BZ3501_MvSof-1269-A2-R1_Chr2-1g03772 [Microbotryum saponariae]
MIIGGRERRARRTALLFIDPETRSRRAESSSQSAGQGAPARRAASRARAPLGLTSINELAHGSDAAAAPGGTEGAVTVPSIHTVFTSLPFLRPRLSLLYPSTSLLDIHFPSSNRFLLSQVSFLLPALGVICHLFRSARSRSFRALSVARLALARSRLLQPSNSHLGFVQLLAAGSVTQEEPVHHSRRPLIDQFTFWERDFLLSSLSLPLALIVITWASVASASTQGRGLPSDAAARHQRLARAQQAGSGHHWSLDRLPGGSPHRFVRARRGDKAQKHVRGVTTSEPTNLSKGSLTVAQGCTKFYKVKPNDSCYSAIAASNSKLTLDEFYALNPQVDGKCFNLWTRYHYCVEKAPGKSKAKVHVASAKKAATTTETKKPVQTKKQVEIKKPVETKKPVEKPSAPTDDDEDDGECDADDDDGSTPKSTTKEPAKTTALAESSGTSHPKNTGGAVKAFVSGGTNNKGDGSHDDPSTSSAPPATTQQPKPSVPSPTGSSSSGSSSGGSYPPPSAVEGIMRERGITTFMGNNTHGILSWFRTNSAQDSTNGRSWCYNSYDAYNDNIMGFAIDVNTMLANFDNSNIKAGQAFCGANANFTSHDGKVYQLSMIDGFDSKWSHGKTNAADLTVAAWTALAGFFRGNKNDVLQRSSWQWTGTWESKYAFNGGKPV